MIELTPLQLLWLEAFRIQHEQDSIAVVGGDRKAGKTTLALYILRQLAIADSHNAIITYNPNMKQYILRELVNHLVTSKVRYNTGEIITLDGAYIRVAHHEDYLRGTKFDVVVFDNGQLPSMVMRHLIRTTGAKGYVFL